jgi:hypothetical protein
LLLLHPLKELFKILFPLHLKLLYLPTNGLLFYQDYLKESPY